MNLSIREIIYKQPLYISTKLKNKIMVTYSETLERIKDKLWKPLHLDINKLDEDNDGSADPNYFNALLFDITKADEDTRLFLLEDTFDDGMPDDLDFETKVPIGIIGQLGTEDEGEYGEGVFGVIAQPDFMLFADIENGEGNKVPIYAVDIDGTALEEIRKVADDITELDFKNGFAPQED